MKNLTLRILIGIFVIGFCMGSALISIAPRSDAEALGSWNPTTSYPFSVSGESCVTFAGYIYCVGGFDFTTFAENDTTYYGVLSSSGISAWNPTNDYPTNISEPSCAVSTEYIYSVGGLVSPGTVTSAVYYAPISSSGIGTWTPTTALPTGLAATSCTIYNGYIYCVGGITYAVSPSRTNTNATYYAKVSSNGVGSWSPTTSYPTNIQLSSCTTTGGYIYCVGGQYNPNINGDDTNATYYAAVNSTGIGTWISGADYPVNVDSESCVFSPSSYIYCVAGYVTTESEGVYYASLSSSGISTWTQATMYPTYADQESCVFSNGDVYCVGGFGTSSVYYSSIGSFSSSSSTLTNSSSSTFTSSSYLTSSSSFTSSSTTRSSSSTSSSSSTTKSSSSSQASSQSSFVASSITTSIKSTIANSTPPTSSNPTLYIAIGAIFVIGIGLTVGGLYLRRGRAS